VRLQQHLEDKTIDYDVSSRRCNRLALYGALHPLVPYARSLWRVKNVKQ
jgi:hypothetical protein